MQSYSRQQPSSLTPAMTSETLETIAENIARKNKMWGKSSKRLALLKFSFFSTMISHCSSHYSNEITLSHTVSILSDPTAAFRPMPRTASVSLQKHVGNWQYLHVMEHHWKGSELFTRVLHEVHDFQRMTEKFRGHSIWFQSSNILPVYDRDYDSDTCEGIRIPVWFRVEPCGF